MTRTWIAALLFFFALSSAARAQRAVPAGLVNIGVAAAVRGSVRAAAPSQVGREVKSGQPVYLNDHVTTGPGGRLQILLNDETTFTLGPNADMVLDEFVYDPKTGDGKISARIASGAFRFITGKVAQKDPANMKVKLPVGTIGIRGTMVAGHAHGKDAEIVLVGPGRDNDAQERRGGITVFNERGGTDVDSSGYGVTIAGGGRPSRAFRFSPAQLNAIFSELEPRRTAGNGGPDDAPKRSGEALAHGGINYRDFEDFAAVNQNLNQTATYASQQSVASGCSGGADCWSDLIALQSGSAGYTNTGSFSCSGAGCTEIGASTFFYAVNVNFASRQFGADGGEGTLRINGGDGTYDSISVPTLSYSALSGPAKYTYTAADLPVSGSNTGNGNFAGTSIQFLKSGGQPAAAMQINLSYVNTSNAVTLTGTSTASKGNFYNP